jgi:hypothetical protein
LFNGQDRPPTRYYFGLAIETYLDGRMGGLRGPTMKITIEIPPEDVVMWLSEGIQVLPPDFWELMRESMKRED